MWNGLSAVVIWLPGFAEGCTDVQPVPLVIDVVEDLDDGLGIGLGKVSGDLDHMLTAGNLDVLEAETLRQVGLGWRLLGIP